MDDAAWWPIQWSEMRRTEGYRQALVDLPNRKNILITGWGLPVTKIRIYANHTTEEASSFADNELQLRCILMELADAGT